MVGTRPAQGPAQPGRSFKRLTLWSGGAGVAIVVATVAVIGVSGGSNLTANSTTTSTVRSTTPKAVPTVTLSAVGDSELGNTPRLPPDPATYMQPVKAALAAPITFGNLEGTMTNASSSKCSASSIECYAFRVPTSYAEVYRADGFRVLNSANNHSHDFGEQGVLDTSAALRRAKIVQAGLPGQIGVVREGSIRVAFVDFAPYSNTNDLLNFSAAAQLIARAKREAKIVVVYMHAGAEGPTVDHVTRTTETYAGENRGNPYAFAHAAINDGADLVIASGPHVLRGMEWFKGHLIDYSLGDFANYYDLSTFGVLDLSGILHVTLTSTGACTAAHFTSLRLSPAGQPFIDRTRASAKLVNELSRQDFGANGAVIKPNGVIRLPGR